MALGFAKRDATARNAIADRPESLALAVPEPVDALAVATCHSHSLKPVSALDTILQLAKTASGNLKKEQKELNLQKQKALQNVKFEEQSSGSRALVETQHPVFQEINAFADGDGRGCVCAGIQSSADNGTVIPISPAVPGSRAPGGLDVGSIAMKRAWQDRFLSCQCVPFSKALKL